VSLNSSAREPNIPASRTNTGLLAFVFLGLAMVACATAAMPWPSDVRGQANARLVSHWDRMLGTAPGTDIVALPESSGPDATWIWRRAWDGLHYGLVLGGVGLAVLAAMRRRRGPWIGLAAIGVAGTFYAGSMALYSGPLVATPGYLLVLIGGALGALTR
jgi:hypothetical protein